MISHSLDDIEGDQTIREMQREVDRRTRENRALNLSYLVERQAIALVSRISGKFLLKIDLQPRIGVFCKITDVLEMYRYMDNVGGVKVWDDHKSHTSVLRSPQTALSELARRMNSAIAAYRQRGVEFDQARNH